MESSKELTINILQSIKVIIVKCVTDVVKQSIYINTIDDVINELTKKSYEFSGKDY